LHFKICTLHFALVLEKRMPMFDLHMLFAILGVALVGGLIGLDRTAAGQFMISQPIVAAPLVGWLLGDATAGLIIGAMLELIWVLDMPVGSFVPADATISAVTATAIAALTCPGGAPRSVLGFCILLSVGTVPFTMMADTAIRGWNSRLVDAAHAVAGADAARSLSRAHLTGLCVFFLKSVVLYSLLLPAGLAAAALFLRAPSTVQVAMELFLKLLPMLGVAIVVRRLSISSLDPFLLTGFITAGLATLVLHLHAVMVTLLTIVTGWLGVRYREQRP
jgi:mannose/fructose/N-acetylgalactosamine-specific phosphotransferase system component IIC